MTLIVPSHNNMHFKKKKKICAVYKYIDLYMTELTAGRLCLQTYFIKEMVAAALKLVGKMRE